MRFVIPLLLISSALISKPITLKREQMIDAKNATQLKISQVYGDITITPSEFKQIHVTTFIKGTFESGLMAEDPVDIFKEVKTQFTMVGTTITLKTIFPSNKDLLKRLFKKKNRSRLKVDYLLRIPNNMAVDITTLGSNILINKLERALTVTGVTTNITLDSVKNKSKIRSFSSNMQIQNSTGEFSVVSQFQNFSAINNKANITLNFKRGRTSIKNLSGIVRIEADHADVGLNAITGESRLDTVSGSIIIKDNGSPVHISTEKANTGIQFTRGIDESSSHISSKSGRVSLFFSEDAHCNINVQSKSNEIESDFNLYTVSESPLHLKGKINGGGGLVTVNAVSAPVVIKKLAN